MPLLGERRRTAVGIANTVHARKLRRRCSNLGQRRNRLESANRTRSEYVRASLAHNLQTAASSTRRRRIGRAGEGVGRPGRTHPPTHPGGATDRKKAPTTLTAANRKASRVNDEPQRARRANEPRRAPPRGLDTTRRVRRAADHQDVNAMSEFPNFRCKNLSECVHSPKLQTVNKLCPGCLVTHIKKWPRTLMIAYMRGARPKALSGFYIV